jgi:hypothetical protein
MRRRPLAVLAAATVLFFALGGSAALAAQVLGYWRGPIVQNNPPKTDFVFARWKYTNNGNIGGVGWAHNYPEGEMHLNEFIKGVTGVNVERMSYRIVDLSSDEVFRYPFALVSEPGEMNLTDIEFENLREYVERGGFILVDDFDGEWQLANFQRQLAKAFPDRSLERLKSTHPIFNTFYSIESLETFDPYVPGGEPAFYGLNNSLGMLAIVACHNNDLQNFWDWIGTPSYPLRPSTEAFRVGANATLYSMTH